MGEQKSLLINASNLHVGGGVQVATSVIAELSLLKNLPSGLVVWASSEVDLNLRKLGCDLDALPRYEIVDSYGLLLIASKVSRRFNYFDVVFTIFGPLYVLSLTGKSITGFAQAFIISEEDDIYSSLKLHQRFIRRFKFKLQSLFFKKTDHLVAELDHVRLGLIRRKIGSNSNIHIIRNCFASVYLSPNLWRDVVVDNTFNGIKLGFVGRNYSHKNTRIFPEIIKVLQNVYGIKSRVYVTFTNEEWLSCSEEFRRHVINVGSLSVSQCPTFYSRMDAVIFPSLLECFSATPLEAMVMQKPLFASDRQFNRDICFGHAHYFDPLSPATAANAIAQVFLNGGPNAEELMAAREHAINFSNPKERAEQYLSLLLNVANEKL